MNYYPFSSCFVEGSESAVNSFGRYSEDTLSQSLHQYYHAKYFIIYSCNWVVCLANVLEDSRSLFKEEVK